MWYKDFERGEKLFHAMRKDVMDVEEGLAHPLNLMRWSPDDVHEMLEAWGFFSEYLPGPARLRWHPKHPDLDLVVPWADPVQFEGVLEPAVRLVESLKKREGLPIGPMKKSGEVHEEAD